MHHPARLFYSYSTRDESLRRELEAHLATLQHDGVLAPWSCRAILAGADWDGEIRAHLDSADVILLLVSADFLSSSYIRSTELSRALQRHSSGEAVVVPVVLRPCDWKTQRFASLQALPTGGKPVTKTRPRDDAWTDIAVGIRRLLEDRRKALSSTGSPRITAVGSTDWDLVPFDTVREEVRSACKALLDAQEMGRSMHEVDALAEIRDLAPNFVTRSIDVRRVAASDVSSIASKLSLASILELVLSNNTGERVAAGIALHEYLARQTQKTYSAIHSQVMSIGLRDSHPRVRYRFIEAAADHPDLLLNIKSLLQNMANNDPDGVVRETAARILARMAG